MSQPQHGAVWSDATGCKGGHTCYMLLSSCITAINTKQSCPVVCNREPLQTTICEQAGSLVSATHDSAFSVGVMQTGKAQATVGRTMMTFKSQPTLLAACQPATQCCTAFSMSCTYTSQISPLSPCWILGRGQALPYGLPGRYAPASLAEFVA